jgi:hypothetical protein
MDKNISIFPYMGKITFVEWVNFPDGKITFVEWVNFSLYGKNRIRGIAFVESHSWNRIRGIAEKNNSH